MLVLLPWAVFWRVPSAGANHDTSSCIPGVSRAGSHGSVTGVEAWSCNVASTARRVRAVPTSLSIDVLSGSDRAWGASD